MTPDRLTTEELLRYADRSDPTVRALCERLEATLGLVDHIKQGLVEANELATRLHRPVQGE